MKSVKIFTEKGIRIDKSKIDNLLKHLSTELNFKVESFEINFVNSTTIENINKNFLNHEGTTDIITFNYSEEKYRFDAEIFISIPDAIENAKKYNVNIDNELGRLIIHGVLHLLGYDDLSVQQKRIMKRKENLFVKKFEKLFKGIFLK